VYRHHDLSKRRLPLGREVRPRLLQRGNGKYHRSTSLDEELEWALKHADKLDPLTPLRKEIAEVMAEYDAGEPAQNTEDAAAQYKQVQTNEQSQRVAETYP